MAKNLADNFDDSKWVGPTVKLTPTDKVGTPETFEKLYDRRKAPKRIVEDQPKLKEIDKPSMSELLERVGLGES